MESRRDTNKDGTTNTVAAAAVAHSADEARPPGFAKHSTTTESVPELVESFGEDSLSDQGACDAKSREAA